MKKKIYRIPTVKIVVLKGEGLLAGSPTNPDIPLEGGGTDNGEGATGEAKSFSGFYDFEE